MDEAASLTIVDDLSFWLEEAELLRRLHVDDTFVFIDDVRRIAHQAESLARPKGLYKLSAVEHTGDTTVTLDGITFTSRVLRVNLDGMYRAFPFLATCGRELDAWSRSLDDPVQGFWADTIKEMALHKVIQNLGDRLVTTYQPGERAVMNPGSLPDWPISEQQHLFALFGSAADAIGVTLTESFLMSPIKSVSGVWFQSDKGFVNCQLCPREECPNRRAPHDPHLFGEQYQ